MYFHRIYGTKALPLKIVIPKVLPLLEDRDKTVREEARNLIIEIYRWVGENLKPRLSELKPDQVIVLLYLAICIRIQLCYF